MEILIFAVIAVFILLKLYSILGQDHGESDFMRRFSEISSMKDITEAKNIDTVIINANPEINDILIRINSYDSNFCESKFIQGASKAYSMIIEAYSKNDKDCLKALLDYDLYTKTSSTLEEQRYNNKHTEKTIVSIKNVDIVKANISDNTANIYVKIITDQIILVKDNNDTILDGDPTKTYQIEDNWCFSRNIYSKSPNWQLTKTTL